MTHRFQSTDIFYINVQCWNMEYDREREMTRSSLRLHDFKMISFIFKFLELRNLETSANLETNLSIILTKCFQTVISSFQVTLIFYQNLVTS